MLLVPHDVHPTRIYCHVAVANSSTDLKAPKGMEIFAEVNMFDVAGRKRQQKRSGATLGSTGRLTKVI